MGYDKYGLDWSVWGGEPEKPKPKEPEPLKTLPDKIKKVEKKKAVEEEIDLSEVTNNSPQKTQKPTFTLSNARFITDETTDFNKPCKVEVDVEGTLSGPVSFALWAKYKDVEYDLQHEKNAFVKDGKASTELKLFYVDKHYEDINQNGKKDAIVEYFLKVTAKGGKPLTGKPFTMPCTGSVITVDTKVKAEYPLVILDRKLSSYQDSSETKISSPPVYIELFLEQSSTAQIFDKGAVVTVSGPGTFNCFEDQECTIPFDLSKPLANEKITGGNKLKIWLTGKTAGKCRLEIKPQDPAEPFVAGDTAIINIAVIEFMLSICKQDEAAIQKIQIDPDQDPAANYYTALKNQKIPEQIEVSDQDKVRFGRYVHVQENNNFSRAKLILKKIDGSQLPGGIDDYEVVVSKTNNSGSVELHSKEWDDSPVAFPVKVKLKDLKNSDRIFWVQGKSATQKINDIMLDCGLSNGGASQNVKRYADFVRFSVVEITEVKVDYTPVTGQAAACDAAKSHFFINTKADPDGRKVTIGAKLSEPVKDVTIHFMLAPHKDNQKKANWGIDLPSTWKWKDISPDLKHKDKANRKDLVHLSAKTDATGYAKKELILSRFGGDQFYLCAYIDQDPHCAKFIDGEADLQKKKPVMAKQVLTVRRKFWYQMTKAKGYSPPQPKDAITAYDRVRTDMILDQTVEFEEATAPAGTFYPEYVVKGGASISKIAVIGDCNKNAIANQFFKSKSDQPVKNHLIVCDKQYDALYNGKFRYADGQSDPITSSINAGETVKIQMTAPVFDPTLHGSALIVKLYWYRSSLTGSKNNIPHNNVIIPRPRLDENEIEIILPALSGTITDPVFVYAKCFSPWGPFLGESFGKHSLIVYDSSDVVDYNDTVIHEIGHAFNQTPLPNKQPDSAHIPAHPNQALGDGNHCQEIDAAGQPICVMYDSGPLHNATALHRFCDVCHPYLIIEDLYRP